MKAARTKKTKAAAAAVAEAVAVAAAVPVATVEAKEPEPVPVPAPATPATKKKQKKIPAVVAVVTPDGIQGSFLPEPRKPLIAHLQIHSSEVQFHDTPIHYDPNPPGELKPYDAGEADFFAGFNAEIQKESSQEAEPIETAQQENKEPATNQAAQGLEAFTKADLMVQFRTSKITQKLPDTTEIACFWCAHAFDWKPCILPEREEKGVYRVYGNFCCPSCAMAYVLNESLDSHVRWERMALLHRIYAKAYVTERIFPAPARESLRQFGGPMTIEQFRSTVAAGKVRVDLQLPPMVSILGSIDTKPVDFYDSSLKNTMSPLLGETVPKAEEGLRLKRSKPLRDKESTLDSCLKIQIKGRA